MGGEGVDNFRNVWVGGGGSLLRLEVPRIEFLVHPQLEYLVAAVHRVKNYVKNTPQTVQQGCQKLLIQS